MTYYVFLPIFFSSSELYGLEVVGRRRRDVIGGRHRPLWQLHVNGRPFSAQNSHCRLQPALALPLCSGYPLPML